MKNKKEAKKLKSKAARRNSRPIVDAPAPAVPPPPSSPPLAGEELERKIADVLCIRFRETPDRAVLRKVCQGAEHTAIEEAIVSPRVKAAVEPVAQAFALEHCIDVLRLLLSNARAALTVEKPTPAQILSLKIVFETLVEKMMGRIGGGLWQEAFSLLGFSDHEKSLIENLIQLVRGQRAPVPEALQAAADPAESTGIGA